jgi:hypothetical protein
MKITHMIQAKCWTLIDIDSGKECGNPTGKLYDYHSAKGATPMRNIPICDDCVAKTDITTYLNWKEKDYSKMDDIGSLSH